MSTNLHKTVLLRESVEGLALKDDSVIVDATLGGGGHAEEICKRLSAAGVLVGIDADAAAIELVREKLSRFSAKKILVRDNFEHLTEILAKNGIREVDGVLFDLGWSQNQLELSGRGFSFQKDEPLLMTLSDDASGLTAYEIVNGWGEEEIANVIYEYGEERRSRSIARAIVAAREEKPIETTTELVEIISSVVPRTGKIHPATRTFQALRIAANRELAVLSDGLEAAWKAVTSGGRVAVISFHSLEDRIVKHFFKGKAADGFGELITKKPITASEVEEKENPRSRSAKLRIIQKK